MRPVLLLLLFGACVCIEFVSLEGKLADPCNKYLSASNQFKRDCPPHSQAPAPSVTVLIPSAGSPSSTVAKTAAAGTLLNQILTLRVNQLPSTQVGRGAQFLALATSEDSCNNIDTTLNFLNVDPSATPPLTVVQNTVTGPTLPAYDIITFALSDVVTPTLASMRAWNVDALAVEDRPRMLCWTYGATWNGATLTWATGIPGGWQYTGFKIGVAYNCDSSSDCGAAQVTSLPAAVSGLLTPLQRQARLSRTYCCKNTALTGANIMGGQCINPSVQDCCGAAAYEISNEKCCSTSLESVSQVDGLCSCSTGADCPVGEQCCLPVKYTIQTTVYTNGATTTNDYPHTGITGVAGYLRGQCYRPTRMHCCDTGSVFDPGSHQCCRINGVQSLNIPCPCSQNSDCVTQHYPVASQTTNFTCCASSLPTPFEVTSEAGNCNIYANYPTGQGVAETQRCIGACMNPTYQVCCNGAICMNDYEKCCNSTCCNIWTSTCFSSLRAGARGSRANNWNYGLINALVNPQVTGTPSGDPEIYFVCSEIEAITTLKGFWIFVLPSMLLLASHVGLALVLVFAAKATPRSFSKLEFIMMGLALVTAYLAMPLFFAPVWKFPIWIIFAQLLVFLTASARIRWLNILCVVIQAVTLIYVFDPFHGNAFLTLSSNRIWQTGTVVTGAPDDVMQSGLLHAIVKSWHTVDLTNQQAFCSTFYDYFIFDPNMRDLDRFDNGQITMFGYCSRGWVTAQLIFSYFVMMGVLIQLILSLIGVFIRFHKNVESEIEEYEPQY
jgi:hypothetical protein